MPVPVTALIALLFLAASPVTGQTGNQTRRVTLGVETLLADSIHLVRGRRVGLITNHTGRDSQGRSTIDILHRTPGVALAALFAPEHGIRGTARAGEPVASSTDRETGITIHSLYGDTRVPTQRMLAGLDVLLYDIQDVGARPYTYVWTMALATEAAGRARKKFIVLDRPNPIRADRTEGGMLRAEFRSFTGLHPVPIRYGLTPGELIRYLAGTGVVRADVTVIPMKGYRRAMWWDATGIPWVNPSPNIRDLETAILYPGTVFFEATNLSVGRGTDAPFKLVGAPWLTDAPAIARELNAKQLPGVRFDATTRTIERGNAHGGRRIPMIRVSVTDRDAIRPTEVGVHMLRAIYARHRRQFRWRDDGIERLSGSRALRRAVERGRIEQLLHDWDAEAREFERKAAPYRLYPR